MFEVERIPLPLLISPKVVEMFEAVVILENTKKLDVKINWLSIWSLLKSSL